MPDAISSAGEKNGVPNPIQESGICPLEELRDGQGIIRVRIQCLNEARQGAVLQFNIIVENHYIRTRLAFG